MKPLIPGTPRLGAYLHPDQILWRYLDTAKFADLITKKSLHFCRGDQFEDKFEGSFTSGIAKAIDAAYQKNSINFTYAEFRKRLRERVFVNCWHRGIDDNVAMWKLYGQSQCALAITTTAQQLANAIEGGGAHHEFLIERVKYIKHWRNPKLQINPYSRVFAYKVKAYEYENEVRVILDRLAATFADPMNEIGMTVPVNLGILLRSIVLAPGSPAWYEGVIRRLAADYGVICEIRRSKLETPPL